MSACAVARPASAAAPSDESRGQGCLRFRWRVVELRGVVDRTGFLSSGASGDALVELHGVQAAEEQIAHDRRHVGVRQAPPPGLSQVNIQLIMPNSSIASGLSSAAAPGRSAVTASANAATTRRCAASTRARSGRPSRKLDVLGQHAVRVLRAGVVLDEAQDQFAQVRLRRRDAAARPRAPAFRAAPTWSSAISRRAAACRARSGTATAWKCRRPARPGSSTCAE